jgi:2-polyprenyl-3-methyl-5-hydroxy-6-metoxy-1,4-benzoquinol methylase
MSNQSAASDPRFVTCYGGHNPALESLIPERVKTALDVGCGLGGMAAWLSERGIEVDGISWNLEELESAKSVCRAVIHCDLNTTTPDLQNGPYDLIICSHLLEHIAYPERLLGAIYRSLKSNGRFLVAVPNIMYWRDRFKILFGKWEYQSSGTFDYTHLRWYTRKSMAQLLMRHGFVIERFVGDGWIPLPGLKFIVSKEFRSRINRAAANYWPEMFGHQLIYRCIKGGQVKQ